MSKAVHIFSSMSKSQLNNVIFTRNNLRKKLRGMQSNSRAIIKNKKLTENNASQAVNRLSMRNIQLNIVVFT